MANHYTPAPPKVDCGYTGFTPISVGPSVRPSVRPSVCRQGFRNFFKKLLAQFISYLAFTLIGWVSWPLFIHCVHSLIFGPLVAKYLAEMGFPDFFWKTIPFITYLAFTLRGIFGWDYFWMRWVVIRAEVYCPHLWVQLVSSVLITYPIHNRISVHNKRSLALIELGDFDYGNFVSYWATFIQQKFFF